MLNETEKGEKPRCLNCNKKMPRKSVFCPNCGQKNNQGKVTMQELLGKVWFNIFHINGRFLKMSTHLFVPAQVSIAYFRGQQRRYPHPFQFFFVVMFFFLLAFNKFYINAKNDQKDDSPLKISISNSPGAAQSEEIHSMEDFLNILKQHAQNLKWRKAYSQLPDEYKTPDTKRLIDTLFRAQFAKLDDALKAKPPEGADSTLGWNDQVDSLPIAFGVGERNISIEDLAFTEANKIIEKYKIEVWWEKVLIKQSLKSLRDAEGLKRNIFGSFTWAILVLTALMSVVLMLLFRKQRNLFVEHFVFLLHFHTSMMLGMALAITLQYFLKTGWVWFIFLLWLCAHLWWSVKRFYLQSSGTLVLKFIVFNLFYLFLLSISFLLAMIITFLIF